MATGARRPSPARIGVGPEPIKALSVDVGWTIGVQFETPPHNRSHNLLLTGSRPTLRRRPDALDAPDFVGIGAKPTREDGQRGRRNGGGSPWVPCQLARPRPRWTT